MKKALKILAKIAAIGGAVYAALFAVFYFDLDGKAIFIAVNTADHPVSVTVAVPGDAPRKLTLRRYEVLILKA